MGDDYSEYGRISASTGLPTVLGWKGHEHQWRGSTVLFHGREEQVAEIYGSDDPDKALSLLETYDIRYVYMGHRERDKYGTELLEGAASFLRPVFQDGDVVIYERIPGVSPSETSGLTVITMKIDAHRHSGEGRNPGAGRWTPAFAGVTVGRPTVIFIPLRGLHKDMSDSGVGRNPEASLPSFRRRPESRGRGWGSGLGDAYSQNNSPCLWGPHTRMKMVRHPPAQVVHPPIEGLTDVCKLSGNYNKAAVYLNKPLTTSFRGAERRGI